MTKGKTKLIFSGWHFRFNLKGSSLHYRKFVAAGQGSDVKHALGLIQQMYRVPLEKLVVTEVWEKEVSA